MYLVCCYLFVSFEVGKLGRDVGVYFRQGGSFQVGGLYGHGDESYVGIGRFALVDGAAGSITGAA